MRGLLLLAAVAAVIHVPVTVGAGAPSISRSVQLQMQTAPQTARIGGDTVLACEVHVMNRSDAALTIERVIVGDADSRKVISTLGGPALALALHGDTGVAPPPMSRVEAGAEAVVYLWLRFAPQDNVPTKVLTRVEVSAGVEHGGFSVLADVSDAPVVALSPPLAGGPWVAVFGPDLDRGHRRVFYTVAGRARIPGRFAIDWFKLDAAGRMFEGQRGTLENWHGYGADVLAVADARVAAAVDGRPDRNFRPRSATHDPAQGSGNHISLDLGHGRFAFYEHLKPGSVRVRPGDRVRRGQVIAALGDSGDTAGPHLHFHVADANATLGAEGVPFAIDSFEQVGVYASIQQTFAGVPWSPSGPVEVRNRMPAANAVVRFPTP